MAKEEDEAYQAEVDEVKKKVNTLEKNYILAPEVERSVQSLVDTSLETAFRKACRKKPWEEPGVYGEGPHPSSYRHSASLHKKAWEVFRSNGGYKKRTAKAVGIHYLTLMNWGWKDDFECPWRCPYHNYDHLIEATDLLKKFRYDLLRSGETDMAIIHAKMLEKMSEIGLMMADEAFSMKALADNPDIFSEANPIFTLLNSDDERISMYDYIKRKAFYEATGMVNSPETALYDVYAQTFKLGAHLKDLKKAVDVMVICDEQIDKYSGANEVQQDEDERVEVSIETLMQLKQSFKREAKKSDFEDLIKQNKAKPINADVVEKKPAKEDIVVEPPQLDINPDELG